MPHVNNEARREYMRVYAPKYYKRNKKVLNAKNKERYWKNRKAVLAGMKAWYAGSKQRINAERQITVNKRKGVVPTRKAPKRCESCAGPTSGQGRLHVDHCHATGKFRGWLCFKCNVGIGLLGDSSKGLRRALRYLERKR